MTDTITCSNCHGKGEVNTGMPSGFSACSSSWAICRECHGTGIVDVPCQCQRCFDTGIDLEAPFNAANPPACPMCHPVPEPTPAMIAAA